MLKEPAFLTPLEEKEIPVVARQVFQADFLDYIFGHHFDPVQLVEDYFGILKDDNCPPKNLIFKITPSDERVAGLVWFESIHWINRNLVMTIYLLPSFRTSGLGAKALYYAGYQAFKVMNMKKIKSYVYRNNTDMLKIMKRLGVFCEGQVWGMRIFEGNFQDALIFSFTREFFSNSSMVKKGYHRWEN